MLTVPVKGGRLGSITGPTRSLVTLLELLERVTVTVIREPISARCTV